jgi:hypothetical protein
MKNLIKHLAYFGAGLLFMLCIAIMAVILEVAFEYNAQWTTYILIGVLLLLSHKLGKYFLK